MMIVTDCAPGAPVDDPVINALGKRCEGLRRLSFDGLDAQADRESEAFSAHPADGGMRKPAGTSKGGLAPWQLRLARRLLNDLDSSASLARIAGECGLSAGHFARAFKHSTGLTPHQWVLRRRVDAAKDMLDAGVPLAEIAVACRFSDQSHLTRAFAHATGVTPGRWRTSQGRRPSSIASD